MKKALSLLMVLCLLLPLAALGQDALLVPLYPRSQLNWQGGLYLWSREGLHQVDQATGQTALIAAPPEGINIEQLLVDGDQLYGLDAGQHLLYQLQRAGGQLTAGLPVALGHELLEDPQEQGIRPLQSLMYQGKLYLLYEPQTGGWQRLLIAFDAATGEGSRLDLEQAKALTLDDQGRLLYISLDTYASANTPDLQDDLPALMAYDLATGAATQLGQLQQPWRGEGMVMAWDREDQSLLYVSEQKLYRWHGDGSEAFLGQLLGFYASAGMTFLPLQGGRVSVILQDGVRLMDAQPAAEAPGRAFTVYGAADRSMGEAAAKGLHRTVDFKEASWNQPQELAQILQAGSSDIDVMVLQSLHDELERLVDKGYLLDLSQSPALAQHIRRCYPLCTAPGQRGEAMYLLPVQLSSTLLIARPQLFEQAGKGMPDSFEAFCDFLNTWSQEDMDRLSQYQPWAEQSPQRALLQLALRTAFAEQALAGEPLSFDTPLMRSLLDAALKVDTAPMEHGDGDYSFMDKPPLVRTTNYSLGILTTSGQASQEEAEEPLLLPAATGRQPAFPAEVQYLAIYARSPHQQAALQYLEGWLQALSHENRVMLYPDFDQPLELQGITRVLERYAGEIAQLEQQVAAASGAEKRELEGQLAQKREQQAGQEAMRYHISPQVIAQYRGLMRHGVLANRALHLGWHQPDIRGLLDRLKDGQLSLDQFISEAQGKLRLIQLEDQ